MNDSPKRSAKLREFQEFYEELHKLPDVFLLPHENNSADQPGPTEDGEVDEERKLPGKRKHVKGEKEKKKKRKAKKKKKCRPEETEEGDMNIKASEESKEAATNSNVDLPSTSASNRSEDLFDNDDELEDFMS
ncbi:hypothetical protein FOCC_FOCC013728 [Frankliniella occidentalis]|nr:hypothetical protein FOCC_FOCC013728 [Frankliniella occidentalis]